MDIKSIEKRVWWGYLGEDLQELLKASLLLSQKVNDWSEKFDDYAFVVFPAAKAYEGFLKKLFLDMGFITEKDYYGKHFRIGKSLNPSLPKEFRKEWVYGKIGKYCGGKDLGDKLWEVWKYARNLTFHWFPKEKNAISLGQAKYLLTEIINVIDQAFKECKIR